MRVAALATDLDGTLWDAELAVHVETMAVIAELDARRIPLLIATGRRAQSALVGLRRARLDDRPGVLMNGAIARDVLRGSSFLVERIDAESAELVHDAFLEAGLEPVVYIDHPEIDMVFGSDPAVGQAYLDSAPGIRRTENLAAAVREEPVIGFGAFGFPRGQLEPVSRIINAAGLATAILGASILEGDHALMVQGAGVDKQTAIEAWCRRHDVDSSSVVAIGDGTNDLGMLAAAHLAIVPADASPEALALADHVIPPHDEGGWRELRSILGLS